MYRPSQTPRLAVSSARIARDRTVAESARTRKNRAERRRERHPPEVAPRKENAPEPPSNPAFRTFDRPAALRSPRREPHAINGGTRVPHHRVSEETIKVVVFHGRSHGLGGPHALPLMLRLQCFFTEPD